MRVANTGVSAVIDSRGTVVAQLPLNEQGFLDATVPLDTRATLYRVTGDWLSFGLYLLVLASTYLPRRRIAH